MGNHLSSEKSFESSREVAESSDSMKEDEFLYLSRFDTAGKALAELAYVAAQYDDDGIEIQFLNNSIVKHGLKTKEDVMELFQSVIPSGLTPIGAKLDGLMTAYIDDFKKLRHSDKQPKPVNYILLTDGEPTDKKPLTTEEVIVKAAKVLDEICAPQIQVGIQFVQVGADTNATKYLQRLDDNLKQTYNIRDIVDTAPARAGHNLDGQDMIKILTGGINRRRYLHNPQQYKRILKILRDQTVWPILARILDYQIFLPTLSGRAFCNPPPPRALCIELSSLLMLVTAIITASEETGACHRST
ncbi:uncharacterized protein EV420DRAFT_1658991 [Desarmillaria tabescens]|uniref:VWFA domain-containing protein n=1 Tax=Armillaria tabescens TaxID=1929756 RepID=A0AA39U897_ARMTA|nr:uncharacterized protein EV420DRAFT_1658991 [Desarmillaria tabescens]KAK0469275.1 hypothetical protein EV420DRAFT_1658991 [Desarmillaria tabescens]